MHVFNERTIESKMISKLMSSVSMPLLDTVRYGDFIVEGFKYIYLVYIIECTQSGYLLPGDSEAICSNTLFADDYVYVGRNAAKYEIVNEYYFNTDIPNINVRTVFNTDDYSKDLHTALGTYLRVYRDLFSINMMPFYNCFCKQFCRVNLADLTYDVPSNKKVILVPIKFNKVYTVCIDVDAPVKARALLYDYSSNQLVKKDSSSYVTEDLNEDLTVWTDLSYTHPKTYEIQCEDVDVYKYKSYLFLAIELPSNNSSSIAVLEGDYTHHNIIMSIENIDTVYPGVLDEVLLSATSLTLLNDGKIYAFSDKIIEFLSGHMIASQETITGNVRRVQQAINYTSGTNDIWDNTMRYLLYNKYMSVYSGALDITGYVDKQIEDSLRGEV